MLLRNEIGITLERVGISQYVDAVRTTHGKGVYNAVKIGTSDGTCTRKWGHLRRQQCILVDIIDVLNGILFHDL